MTVRPPSMLTPGVTPGEMLHDALQHEILSEKAASLGRAGEKAAQALLRLADASAGDPARPDLRKAAALAVHAWFIQRELCGMRRHGDVIRDLAIPQEVLARLGAS